LVAVTVSFTKKWSEEITDITNGDLYQNALIQIIDPSLMSEVYDYATNTYTAMGDGVVYEGRARLGTRTGQLDVPPGDRANATGEKKTIFQIPHDAYFGPIKRNFKIRVVDGGESYPLEFYMFTVSADVNSSHMASRTIEAIADVTADSSWNGGS
jgi:hypothetical protein